MSMVYSEKDLRSIKTERALNFAMLTLLEHQNFRKVTIRDICEEAVISRATFYAHYADKYDFLKYWLVDLIKNNINEDNSYEKMEIVVNKFVNKNKRVIKSIINGADQETLDIIFDVILLFSGITIDIHNEKEHQKDIVLSNFYVGGIIYYLLWHEKNKFPFEVMNKDFYGMIKKLREQSL